VKNCTILAFSHILRENQDEIGQASVAAYEDNDLEHHDRVPDVQTLETISVQAIAKALPVSFPLTPDFRGKQSSFECSVGLYLSSRFVCFSCSDRTQRCLGYIQLETHGNHEFGSQSIKRSDQCPQLVR
jgi:hypothetical protein